MVASRPGSPYTGRPASSHSVHTKVEEELHEYAGIDYDKVKTKEDKIGINTSSGHHQT
jgi:phosphoenolpyruvate carboxykinase (ATP)